MLGDGDGTFDGEEDYDGDGLSNHDEWVYGTNPMEYDTDGDGVSDGDEVAQGSDPNDPSDGGQAPDPEDLIDVTLQVGDPSGSNSELWLLRVGDIRFKAPGYGEVTPETVFKFLRGRSYNIKVIHMGTVAGFPPGDFDYVAYVEPAGEACAIVDDPDDLLGNHSIDSPDPTPNNAAGKEAWLRIYKSQLTFDQYVTTNWAIDACPNNGGKRIFPEKVGFADPDDPPSAANRRKVKVRAQVSQAEADVQVYFKVFDVDDPSSSGAPVDPNDGSGNTGNDNRDGVSQNLPLSATTDSDGVAIASFTVSMHPGDNYKVFASTCQESIDAVTQPMADGNEALPSGVDASEMLTVWRHLNIELDSMLAPDSDDLWLTARFHDFEKPLGAPDPPVLTNVWRIDQIDPEMIEFENPPSGGDSEYLDVAIGGRLIIGPMDGPQHLEILDAENDIVFSGTGVIQFLESVSLLPAGGLSFFAEDDDVLSSPETMSGTVTEITKEGGSFVYSLNITGGDTPIDWPDFVGGEIVVGGGDPVGITAVDELAETFTTASLSIEISGHDDDVDVLLPDGDFADVTLMQAKYQPAYILPVAGGGGINTYNAAEVSFIAHLGGFGFNFQPLFDVQQSAVWERDDFWIVHVVSTFQQTIGEDWDGLDLAAVPGATGPNITSNLQVVKGGRSSSVCLEVIRDLLNDQFPDPAGLESLMVSHEVGHQFGLGHWNGSLMSEAIDDGGDNEFSNKHLHLLRSRVHSPGQDQ